MSYEIKYMPLIYVIFDKKKTIRRHYFLGLFSQCNFFPKYNFQTLAIIPLMPKIRITAFKFRIIPFFAAINQFTLDFLFYRTINDMTRVTYLKHLQTYERYIYDDYTALFSFTK